MDEFDRITDAIDQDYPAIESETSGSDAIDVAFAKVMSALAALINAATVCGVLTWLGWACVVIGQWVAG